MRTKALALCCVTFCKIGSLMADPCSVARAGRAVTQADALHISFSGMSSADVANAEAYWSGGCPQQYGNNFPTFNDYWIA
jgi:hypothetical protein